MIYGLNSSDLNRKIELFSAAITPSIQSSFFLSFSLFPGLVPESSRQMAAAGEDGGGPFGTPGLPAGRSRGRPGTPSTRNGTATWL